MEDEIKLQDINFLGDFQYTKTNDGFKINANGGEFFPHKNTSLFSTFSYLILIIIFSIVLLLGFSICLKNVIIFVIGLPVCSFLLIAAIVKMKYLTNVKAEYIFSPDGINIISEKGTMVIPKTNIKNMYIKELTMSNGNEGEIVYYYSILISFKEFLYIPYTNQNKETVNLFIDYPFFEEKTASFLLQELNKTIHINYVDNYFEEKEKEKQLIDINEIQFPKDLNYQRIDNAFKVTSVGGIFFPNIYAIPAIIITIIIYAILFLSLNTINEYLIEVIKEHIKIVISSPNFLDLIEKIIIPITFFGSFMIGIFCYYFIKLTNTKADYIFSPNGINIISKGKVFAIKADNIDDIHLENVVSATRIETSTSYKIVLDFKNWICITTNPIYCITKSKISSVDILENFKDKKVCLFFVQEMKRILKIT